MGGGGGGGGSFVRRSPEELARLVRESENKTSIAAFETKLSSVLGDLLGEYNARDDVLVRERLDDLKAALEDSVEGSIDQVFGGSVAKHTYVDGLSDVDALLILDNSELRAHTPDRALEYMTTLLGTHPSVDATVTHGKMAVTVEYPDGMQIQLLPALRTDDRTLKIPSSRRNAWSRINPEKFQAALTRRNQECGGKLVPTIKLAKAINGTLPERSQLSGYHIESLAIAAFRGYDGPKTTSAMLPAFFERAKKLVLMPIRDRTGQSVHVDAYLGPEEGPQRLAVSHVLERIAKRMRNASSSGSVAQWRALFGIDD